MHALFGDLLLPVEQVRVLLTQRGELSALERFVFGITHATLDLAFVLRRVRAAGHGLHAVMAAKIGEFRVECRIIPIRLDDCRLAVVEIEQTGIGIRILEARAISPILHPSNSPRCPCAPQGKCCGRNSLPESLPTVSLPIRSKLNADPPPAAAGFVCLPRAGLKSSVLLGYSTTAQ